MPRCLLGLGANLGDRRRQLDDALAMLARDPRFRVIAASRYRGTTPVGGPGVQGEFLNAAAVLETSAAPMDVWHALRDVEQALGRQRHERWEARSIDLDLLLYDQLVCQLPELTVPHPWMFARRFVLQPAVEIAGDWQHPVLGWSLQELWHHAEHAAARFALACDDEHDPGSASDATASRADGLLRQLLPAIAQRASCRWIDAPARHPLATPIDELDRRLDLLEHSSWNADDREPLLCGFSVESDWRNLLRGGAVQPGDRNHARLRARLDAAAPAKIIFSARRDDPRWLPDLVHPRRSLAAIVHWSEPDAIVREVAGAITAIQSD